jgi:hypothetical protein
MEGERGEHEWLGHSLGATERQPAPMLDET